MPLRVLVGELAEVDLVDMRRAREHLDVGAGGEHAVLRRGQHHRAHLRMLEAKPLDGIRKLDIDAEIVGVELQRVVAGDAAVLVHVERERGDVAIDGEPPVSVLVRMSPEVDHRSHCLASRLRFPIPIAPSRLYGAPLSSIHGNLHGKGGIACVDTASRGADSPAPVPAASAAAARTGQAPALCPHPPSQPAAAIRPPIRPPRSPSRGRRAPIPRPPASRAIRR